MRLIWCCSALLPLIFIPRACHGGNILVLPVEGSHWLNMEVLTRVLHSKGHNITVLRPLKAWYIKENSYYNILTVKAEKIIDEALVTDTLTEYINFRRKGSFFENFVRTAAKMFPHSLRIHGFVGDFITAILDDEELVRNIKDSKFDLLLSDPCWGGGAILAKYFNLPLVYNVRWFFFGETHFIFAPSPLSYIPVRGTGNTDVMTFSQRIKNMILFTITSSLQKILARQVYQDLCDKYLGPDNDYFNLALAADLWLLRVDFAFEYPRPTMPNVVYMGGFHCKPAKPLPEHLEAFVQSSGEHGVIIMSLGSLVSEPPADMAEKIAGVFAQLPQKVIWRYKGKTPAALGNNTLLVDWMPQNDLLGHPKTKLFVSHGGTNGIYEAIYHAVPVVGIPLIFDQHDNMVRLKERGAAKFLTIFRSNQTVENDDNFLNAVQEVLNEPSYRTNMQRLSRLHKDVPMKPLDRAVFWMEFVMRHKGAGHLRTQSYKMPWYAYYSVDVALFLFAFLILSSVIITGMIWSCFRLCLKKKVKSD